MSNSIVSIKACGLQVKDLSEIYPPGGLCPMGTLTQVKGIRTLVEAICSKNIDHADIASPCIDISVARERDWEEVGE